MNPVFLTRRSSVLSYGRGTIQTALPLPNSGFLALSWTEVITPAGYRLDQRGVMPTVCTGGNVTADEVLAALRSGRGVIDRATRTRDIDPRSEEHTSEFQSLMTISYAAFCFK